MNDFNNNPKQKTFNEISGCITDFINGEKYCSLTLSVGHENLRLVNLSVKKELFSKIESIHKIGDMVTCLFFLSSNRKGEKWFTNANILDVIYLR